MLATPCKAVEAGDTVRTLSTGYITNTKCIHKYEERLEAEREWWRQKIELYKDKEDKE